MHKEINWRYDKEFIKQFQERWEGIFQQIDTHLPGQESCMFRDVISSFMQAEYQRDTYKAGYYRDADAVTLTVVQMLERQRDGALKAAEGWKSECTETVANAGKGYEKLQGQLDTALKALKEIQMWWEQNESDKMEFVIGEAIKQIEGGKEG